MALNCNWDFFAEISRVNYQLSKLVDTMYIWLTFMNAIAKNILMWYKADEVEALLNKLKDPQFNRPEPHHLVKLMNSSRESYIILNAFNVMGIITCLLWTIFPFIFHFRGIDVDFAIWMPLKNPNREPDFIIAVLYIWIQTTYLGYNNTTIDSMLAYLMAQIKTQLTILREDLENLVENSEREARLTKTDVNEVANKLFVRSLFHHMKIVSLADELKNIFNVAFLCISLTSALIICTTAFRGLSLEVGSVEFFSAFSYMACIVVDISLLCYYGNEVTYESSLLTESAYKMDWLKLPIKLRKSLIIYMERIKRPITIKGGGIIPLSASTCITVLRSSYTFYTFLKKTDEEKRLN